jgi:putative membrane-bound dehydrogenase-like protein
MTKPAFILAATIALTLPFHSEADSPNSPKALVTTGTVHAEAVPIKIELKDAKELYLIVNDAGDGISADWADWVSPVLLTSDGKRIKLTELTPKLAKSGWNSVNIDKNASGKEMKVKGVTVTGIGTHAPSIIAFDLPRGIVGFEAQAAIDDGGLKQGSGGTAIFQVYSQKPSDEVLTSKAAGSSEMKPYGLEAAKAGMSAFTTPEGLQASLFAAEPMIQNPTNIDIDERGRVWAIEAVNYRKWNKLRPEGDRIVIMESTKGDGLADKETVFYQGPELEAPLGICVLPQSKGTKVIVSDAPNVWLFTDTKGDGVADKKQLLLTGISGVQHDHAIHAFSCGPDGKLYFNMGNAAKQICDPDGKPITDLAGNVISDAGKPYRQGMVLRCDFDGEKLSHFETLAWNFRNNFEVCVDSFGTLWQSDNDDDGNKGVRINYIMEYGNYGYTDEMTGAGWHVARTNMETEIPLRHWHLNDPGVVPNLLQTGAGSPTGILVNEGSLLGPRFTNQIIHCDAGPRVVRAYPVTKDAAGYKADIIDILTSTDSWYRPDDDAIAPDGSLFISDWYDPGVGGHAMGDHDAATIRGRIYRVAPPGSKYTVTPIDLSSPAGAVAALQSPNKVTQYLAWQKLHGWGAEAEPELLKLWKNENPRFRARALHLLARIKGQDHKYVQEAITDKNPDIRITGLRIARELKLNIPVIVAELIKDPDPQVRRDAAIALRGQQATEAATLWAALAAQHDGKDRWYLEALGIGAFGQEERFFSEWLRSVGDKWNTAAGRDIIWRLRASATADYLAKIIADKATPEQDVPRYLRAFDFIAASPEKTKALVHLADLGQSQFVSEEALERLKGADLNENPELKSVIAKTLAASKGSPHFIALVRDFKIKGQGAELLDSALDHPQDALAGEALQLVLAEADGQKIIQDALAGPKSEKVIGLLGSSSAARAVNALAKIVTSSSLPVALRSAAVKALARTQTGAKEILHLAENNQVPADLKLIATTALNLVQYPSLKTDIARLFPAPAALGGKPLPPIAELVKIKGDAAHGKALFERPESSCVTCHRINDKGVDFAPALSEIGSKLPKEAIFESIIDPNAGISMGFETTQLETKDGTVAMGIVRSETNDELVLALPGGATNKFAKNQITKREKLPTSMMPSGLNQALSQQDLVDLVEYLASLKKP